MTSTPKPRRRTGPPPGEIASVGVVGAGTMGRGLAQLCAQKGFAVKLFDSVAPALASARARIEESLAAAAEKGKIGRDEASAALGRIEAASALAGLEGAGIILEAVSEDIKVKRALFADLERAVSPDAILATNTSSLLVRDVASATRSPGRVVGLHFFNPPAAMKLVEVVRAPETEEACYRRAWNFTLELGKLPVAAQDTPGFIVNRVVRPFYLEALRLAGEGRGDFAAIDKAVKARGGLPMGPFELMDLIGLDVNLAISRRIFEALGRPQRLQPHFIQEHLVQAGKTGRKAGKGFYLYQEGKAAGVNPEALDLLPRGQTWARPQYVWDRIRQAICAEAQRAAGEGVASEADIDTAVRLAMNFPKGPFEWKKEDAEEA